LVGPGAAASPRFVIGATDPLLGGNTGTGLPVTDNFPEYFDQVGVPGGDPRFLYSNWNNGLNFIDAPNLQGAGLWLSFQTKLVGVYAGDENNPVYLTDAFNDPEFTLNWLWVQQTATGGSSTFDTASFNPNDLGTASFLGYGDISTDILSGLIDADLNSLTSQTPIAPALPLFATGIGALGLLGWRRKRKAQA